MSKQWRKDESQHQLELDRLAQLVDDREYSFKAKSAETVKVLDRALLAIQKGLAGKALDMLLKPT